VSESCLKAFPAARFSGKELPGGEADDDLVAKIEATFEAILENGVLEQRLY
jgi:hypothetical protein